MILLFALAACGETTPEAPPASPAPAPAEVESGPDWEDVTRISGLVSKHYVMSGPMNQQPYRVGDIALTMKQQLQDRYLRENARTAHWFVAFTSAEDQSVVVDFTIGFSDEVGDFEVLGAEVIEVDGVARYRWEKAGEFYTRRGGDQ